MGEPGSGSALRISWTAAPLGSAYTGTATLVKPARGVTASGSMTATAAGSSYTLQYLVSPGQVPGFAACSILGAGNAVASSSVFTGTLQLTFASCEGSGLEPTGSDRLSLGRQ